MADVALSLAEGAAVELARRARYAVELAVLLGAGDLAGCARRADARVLFHLGDAGGAHTAAVGLAGRFVASEVAVAGVVTLALAGGADRRALADPGAIDVAWRCATAEVAGAC